MKLIYLILALLVFSSIATAIPVNASNAIPAGYHIIDTASSDLNKDNLTDYALVIENEDRNKQLIALFSEQDGMSFTTALQDSEILQNFYDTAHHLGSFKKISCTDTILTIEFAVAQHDTTILQYGFSFSGGKWFLIYFESEKYSSSTTYPYLRNDYISVKFALGEGASWYETSSGRSMAGPIDHYLPFACDVKPLVNILAFKPMSTTDPVLSLSGFRFSDYTKKILIKRPHKTRSAK